ncbi:hypothetical protein R3P38DRAFT_3249313 [Favolaschia claudopus]|uniref:Proteophosphoglycan ppg4 n=1 Tax=Favolaschia claudopus TaxID=2862362 RepID=A0AAW0EI64_9AGAR
MWLYRRRRRPPRHPRPLLTALIAGLAITQAAPGPRLDLLLSDSNGGSGSLIPGCADPDTLLGLSPTSAGSPGAARAASRSKVPPKYTPDGDGVWRRIDSYTLVGSTICDSCATPTTVPLSEDEILNAIPLSWLHTSPSSPARTKITIGLSVVLAIFIVATLIWFHISRTPPLRSDVEKRRHRTPKLPVNGGVPANEKQESPAETLKRKWMARATARWRENARGVLSRQRRERMQQQQSRRASVESLVRASASSNPDANDPANNDSNATVTANSQIPAIPRSMSPTPSCASSLPSSAASAASASSSSLPLASPSLPLPHEPPAYPPPPPLPVPQPPLPHASLRPPPSGKSAVVEDAGAEAFPPYTPREEELVAEVDDFDDYFHHRPRLLPQPTSTAHVATDDKAVLARLAAGASEPEEVQLSESREEEGVPDEDEMFEGEVDRLCAAGPSSRPTSFSLPSAPPRRLPAPSQPVGGQSGSEKRELERAYEEVEFEVEPPRPYYPSAPAYSYERPEMEAGPSTPRASMDRPSAPPFFDEEEGEEEDVEGGEMEATAPPLCWSEEDEEEEDERRGESSTPREESISSPQLSPPRRQHREDGGGTQVHDTGWDGGTAPT